jgi:pimeloyl-ACP methyl ester carboxylesterase
MSFRKIHNEIGAVVKKYPLPGNTGANGRVLLFGPPSAKHVVLFCAGFPDDCMSSFVPLAKRLSESVDESFLCGVTCLPGFDYYEDTFEKHNYNIDGYTFENWVTALRDASKTLLEYSTNEQAEYVGVFHDWGVVAGAMYSSRETDNQNKNKPLFSRLIYLDVLPPPHADYKIPGEKNLYKTAVEVSYRASLALCFVVRRYISVTCSSVTFMATFGILKIFNLLPTCPEDDRTLKIREKEDPHFKLSRVTYMAYPYYQLGKVRLSLGDIFEAFPGFHLPKNSSAVPVLYMYGGGKAINFHDTTWLEFLDNVCKNENKKSKIVKVDGAGHWFYLQHPDLTFDEIKKFICDA